MRRIPDCSVPMSPTVRISRQISNLGSPSEWDQRHFRWYSDDGAINAATALAAEDVDLTTQLALNTNARLRLQIANTVAGNDRASGVIQLQARLRTASFTSEWFNVNSTSPCVRPSAGTPADGAVCTRLLTQVNAGFANAGYDEVDGAAATTVLTAGFDYECEFCIKFLKGHLANGDIVDFRLLQGGTTLNAYTETPSFTVSANTVIFTPTGQVNASHDWTNQAAGAATHAEVDEGVPGDGDTTYMTRLDNTPATSDTIVHTTTISSGTADVNSGADSWGVRSVAKKIGAGTPDTFEYSVLETSTLRAGPFNHVAGLTTSYVLFVDTFNPSAFTNTANLRISTSGNSDAGGTADPTVSVLDVVGQKLTGLDMLPLLGVS